MADGNAALAWCPFPDRESARTTANRLLDEKLIVCANILGEIESVFEWDGERGKGTESGVLFKTHGELLDSLVLRLGELHPYETPAIIGWQCDTAHPDTMAWIAQLTAKPD